MIIEKNGKFYEVANEYSKKELQDRVEEITENINMTEKNLEGICLIELEGLSGAMLEMAERVNGEKEKEREFLESELFYLNEELKKWQ